MSFVIDVECPLCRSLNAYSVDDGNYWGTHVMYCNDCGEAFAISWTLKADVDTYTLEKAND